MFSTGDDDTARVDVPTFPGQRYEVEVPDTLDLSERAALAINAMTRVVAPERDYELYFVAEFAEDPPKLYHEWSGIFNTTKFLEALPLVRTMSGSDFNVAVDAKMMESYLRGTRSDGLYYRPVEDRLWSFYSSDWTTDEVVQTNRQPYGFPYGEGRMMMAMCMWYQHDGDPRWKQLIEAKIKRLFELGYKKDDALYFDRFFLPGQGISTQPPMGFDSWVPYGPITYYQLTGYEPALDFARQQVNRFRRTWFREDGRFLHGHFHMAAAALIEMLEYALTVGDQEVIDLVKAGYEYAKEMGVPLVGFFPEWMRKSFPTCESCGVADMVFLALRLTRAGLGDHWEDADRWVRNNFVESQMTRTDWVDPQKIYGFLNDEAKERIARQKTMIDQKRLCADETDAVERCVGSWAGWALANDWVNPGRAGIMQCCTGNAARTLYYIWDAIVTAEGAGARINFLLNRASAWLDVDSHLPYEGKVIIRNKTAKKLSVRIPEETPRECVTCDVNGMKRGTAWSGAYLEVGGLKPGDVITIQFPLIEKTVFRVMGDVPYKVTLQGNTVVDIDPRGTVCPLYQRDHYKQHRAPMKKTTRFVPRETIAR
ncbi:MAG: hypothetical protein JW889_13030 [Verrucomicrobia bacterium]|nr:hypothetical protein [Verrucomicrobiota bacterium]